MFSTTEKSRGITLPPLSPSKKVVAKAALVNLKEPALLMLSNCFRQFGIQPVVMAADAVSRLKTEKFDACVVQLAPEAQTLVDSVRTSPSNSHMIIYGLGGSAQEAMQFSKNGINAVFREPLERATALKLVRATQMLVLHEFRRYVRVPITTEVSVTLDDGRRFSATSRDISCGGMSLTTSEETTPGMHVEVSFALLTLPRVWVKGSIRWRKSKLCGIHFDPQDDRRMAVKRWIDSYLES